MCRHFALCIATLALSPGLLTCSPAGAEPPVSAKPSPGANIKPGLPVNAKDVTPQVTIAAGPYVRCQSCGAKKRVEITTGAFRIDQDEVTQGQYAECIAAKLCRAPARTRETPESEEPVRGVGWIDADTYCRFVGKRLPTEAEWERCVSTILRQLLSKFTEQRLARDDLGRRSEQGPWAAG